MDQIKAFLVDDEYLERTLIKYSIPWEELGFGIVGEADSGEEMLEAIKANTPDVIFTDICMPFMNGLQMAKKIRELYADMEIVIITGHRDFSFAKDAIKIGVAEYLLKPIDKQELLNVSLRIKSRIEKKRALNREYQSIQSGLIHSPGLPKDEKYSDLVMKTIKVINDSLSDSELSLKNIAEQVYVNPSYLCRVFKKETNKNVTDYITGLRIGKSLDYLNNTNLKAYEIAEKIGINDSHYFSICFKKYIGKSIQEYKRLNLKLPINA